MITPGAEYKRVRTSDVHPNMKLPSGPAHAQGWKEVTSTQESSMTSAQRSDCDRHDASNSIDVRMWASNDARGVTVAIAERDDGMRHPSNTSPDQVL
jgi:hypothetical protein